MKKSTRGALEESTKKLTILRETDERLGFFYLQIHIQLTINVIHNLGKTYQEGHSRQSRAAGQPS